MVGSFSRRGPSVPRNHATHPSSTSAKGPISPGSAAFTAPFPCAKPAVPGPPGQREHRGTLPGL